MSKLEKVPQTAGAIEIGVTTMKQMHVIEFTCILKQTKTVCWWWPANCDAGSVSAGVGGNEKFSGWKKRYCFYHWSVIIFKNSTFGVQVARPNGVAALLYLRPESKRHTSAFGFYHTTKDVRPSNCCIIAYVMWLFDKDVWRPWSRSCALSGDCKRTFPLTSHPLTAQASFLAPKSTGQRQWSLFAV